MSDDVDDTLEECPRCGGDVVIGTYTVEIVGMEMDADGAYCSECELPIQGVHNESRHGPAVDAETGEELE